LERTCLNLREWKGVLDVSLGRKVLAGDPTVDIVEDSLPEPVPAA
jgi:hypothetical protein